jgi:hypothetical protein
MILLGMCHAKIKLTKHKIVYDVGHKSNHCRRTLNRYIPGFMMPIAAYPKGQQDHIHVQSCSCILIQTNTLHIKTSLNSKLNYSTLGTVSHQIPRAGSKRHLVNLKLFVFRTVMYLTIFIPTNAHNKKTVVSQIYDISQFGLNWLSLRTWLKKTRLVANYVTDVQLHLCYFWNNYCEQLANLY